MTRSIITAALKMLKHIRYQMQLNLKFTTIKSIN